MNDIEVSSIDLVEGGNVFKQGHYLTLGYTPRDEKGDAVDLSGKTISVALWGRKGIAFEAAATYNGGVLRFTLNETVDAGDYNVEFTATLSTDSAYRKKFPTNRNAGHISIKRSADDLDVVGISVYTVDRLKAEQQEAQTVYEASVNSKVETLEADFEQAAGALTVDSEVVLARGEASTLRARLDAEKAATTQQLAEKALKVNGLYNVADFGLKGDNSNDAAAFTNMLNLVPNGSRLQFQKGTYNLSGLPKSFNMPEKVLYFYGVSKEDTIISGSLDKTNTFNIMASFKMIDIQLQNWHFIELKKTGYSYNFLTFKECKFVNCDIPGYCFDDTIELLNFTFNDNVLENCRSACRLTAKVRGSNINYNEAKNMTETVYQVGSDLSEGESYKVSFIGNKINGVTMSSSFRAAMFYANEIKATGNFIENMSFAAGVVKESLVMTGIYIRSYAKLSTISNNTFKNIDGWAIQVKDAIGKVSITNNHIFNDNPLHTISRGFHISSAKYINVESNHLEGLKAPLPISCLANNGVILNNVIVDCSSDIGIRAESKENGSMVIKGNFVETHFVTGAPNQYGIICYSIPNGTIEVSGNTIKNIGEKGTKYGIYMLMGSNPIPMLSFIAVNNPITNVANGFALRGEVNPQLKFLKIQQNDLFSVTKELNSTHVALTQLLSGNNMIA